MDHMDLTHIHAKCDIEAKIYEIKGKALSKFCQRLDFYNYKKIRLYGSDDPWP